MQVFNGLHSHHLFQRLEGYIHQELLCFYVLLLWFLAVTEYIWKNGLMSYTETTQMSIMLDSWILLYNKYATGIKLGHMIISLFLTYILTRWLFRRLYGILNPSVHMRNSLTVFCSYSMLTFVTGSNETQRCGTDSSNWGYARGCCCWEFTAMSKVWITQIRRITLGN